MTEPTDDWRAAEARLRRELRWVKGYAAAATAGAAALVLIAAAPDRAPTRFEHLQVDRLDVMEPTGKPRLVLTGSHRAPGPVIGGQEGTRKNAPGGILFYGPDGDEVGGIAFSKTGDDDLAAFLLDYDKLEATGMYRRIGKDGRGFATFFINDDVPAAMSQREAVSADRSRVVIRNPDGSAEIVLNDGNAKPRLRLVVDRAGQPAIELLDAAGKVARRIGADAG